MTLSKVVHVRCTLQMLQCMAAHFYNLNKYQPREDVATGKADEKEMIKIWLVIYLTLIYSLWFYFHSYLLKRSFKCKLLTKALVSPVRSLL